MPLTFPIILLVDGKQKRIKKSNAGTHRAVWQSGSSSHFQFLNNLTYISTHFFTHMYFKKL